MTGHEFVRAGQVRADLPPRDQCVVCGAPEAAHAVPDGFQHDVRIWQGADSMYAECKPCEWRVWLDGGHTPADLVRLERQHAGQEDPAPAELPPVVGPELAEVTAARAILADFQAAAREHAVGTLADPDWLTYALRLAQHLQLVLDAIGGDK